MPQINNKVEMVYHDPDDLRRLVAEEVERLQLASLPHLCCYCGYFELSQTIPRNRYCQFKGMLQVENGRCMSFKVADDWRERRQGDITV